MALESPGLSIHRGSARRRFACGALAALAVAAGPYASFAQYAVPNQDGRLFDANPELGGSRYNTTIGGRPGFVPGNAAAGGLLRYQSLQISSAIPDPSAFRAALGSSALSDFRRDSVSAADYTLGRPAFGPSVYYDPSRTVPTAGMLRTAGVGAGGAASPLDLRLAPLPIANTPRAGIVGLAPISSTPTSTAFGSALLESPAQQYERELFNQRNGFLTQTVTDPARYQATFNTPQAPRALGARPLAGSPLAAVLRSDELAVAPDYRLPNPVLGDAAVPPQTPTPGLLLPSGETPRAPAPPKPRLTDATIVPGYSVFNDMRIALALSANPSADWFREMQQAARESPDLSPELRAQAELEAQELVQRMLNTPLTTLHGVAPTALNDELLKAEALLEIGHYYEAADRYDRAAALDARNPLPYLGKGHALLAAGDYATAAVSLLRGLEAFPDAGYFTFDLSHLMGSGEIVDIRRAEIRQRLAEREDVELRFLLGYLEYHSGNREEGFANLDRAARDDVRGSIISRYPAMLRKRDGLSRPPAPVEKPTAPAANPPAAAPATPAAPTPKPSEEEGDLIVPPPLPPELERPAAQPRPG